MVPGNYLPQGVPANTLRIRHLKSRCKAILSGEFVQNTNVEGSRFRRRNAAWMIPTVRLDSLPSPAVSACLCCTGNRPNAFFRIPLSTTHVLGILEEVPTAPGLHFMPEGFRKGGKVGKPGVLRFFVGVLVISHAGSPAFSLRRSCGRSQRRG